MPLIDRQATLTPAWGRLAGLGEPLDPVLSELWSRACDEPSRGDPVWLHGDLHYANVLVDQGRFSAIVDWGDVCSGDPATDLAAIWLLFAERAARKAALAAYGADHALTMRAMGWALSFVVAQRCS